MMLFSLRNLLLCALSGLLFCGTVAHGQPTQPPQCSPEMLDLNVVTPLESADESKAQWLAAEIRNRGQATCYLGALYLRFPPDDRLQTGDPWVSDSSQAALAFKEKSDRLGAGEVVHFLLAWSTAPLHPRGLVMNDCATHDDMTLSWGFVNDPKQFLEVRHLWMQSCGQFWRSSYRLGPYVPGESIPKEWFDRAQLKASDFTIQNFSQAQGRSSAIRPAVTLRSLSDVEYLKGSFESGYSGYFELFLKVTAPAFPNCPFHSLRKREADGKTVVYLNHCDKRHAQAEPPTSTKETRLLIRELGLLPERAGPVEYDVVSEVLQDGTPGFAHARTRISVRDPNQPMLPAIDTSTPGCQASQLKLTTPPVELGGHWRQARAYASLGEKWYDAKVFELANISGRNCLLGGVPELKFLNPPEIASGSLRPPVCRNCVTPLFKPRESRWIELKPNDSAHFVVARTVFDPDYWFLCTVIGGLELTLPGDKQAVRLPFEAGSCGEVSVSAWRAGGYDADPLNVQYDQHERQPEQWQIAAAQHLPKECAENVTSDTGRPVMFPSRGPVAWGLSTRQATYGQPLWVLLWLYNPTDKPQPVWTCMDIDSFWFNGIDVFDSAGHRVLSLQEEKWRKESESGPAHGWGGMECTRNFPIDIPPHACVHATFSTPAYDLARDLRRYYSLPPGQYFIVPAERGPDHEPVRRAVTEPGNGLAVSVQQE